MKKLTINQELKKKLTIASITLAIILLIIGIAFYIGNIEFRTFVDRHILRKEIIQNNVANIDISSLENPSINAYYKYITILNKNILTTYSSSGKKEYEHEVKITNPLYSSNNRFLAIAEKKGQNLYLISESNLLWQKEIEGEIQKISVNRNGYVSVIITGGSYKAVVATYSQTGKELFKTYLSSTTAIDTAISNDNKYLSIAEINTSGTLIQSNIKVISIEKAGIDPTNSVIYTHNAEANKLITDIKYQDKNNLLIFYDDGIHILYGENESENISYTGKKVTFASIELNNYSVYTIERTVGILSTSTQVIMKNTRNAKRKLIYSTRYSKRFKK